MRSVSRAWRIGSVELTLLAFILLLTGFTLVVALDRDVAPAVVDVDLDIVFITISTLVSAALALLFWGRYREGEGLAALLRASAFMTLLALNLLTLTAMLTSVSAAVGMSLAQPGQLPLLAGVLARGVAAVLLVAAAIAALRGASSAPGAGIGLFLAPAGAVVVAIVVFAFMQDQLPQLLSEAGLAQLRERPDQALVRGETVLLIGLQAFFGALYLVASALSYRLFVRDGRPTEALLAVGMVLAAFGQVHFALHPGAYEGLVTTGDALRVAFYAVLLAAVVVDSRNDVRALRTAHADLRRLRDAELASAAIEERARLAREVHDGLAQDLWYAKLKQGRLMQIAAEAGEARLLAVEVSDAIDSALAEARQAVMALRPQLEGGSLVDVIERYVEDFGDRFGVKAEFEGDGTPPTLPPRAQAEVLRILQEALNNVRKHADATAVRVRLMARPGLVRLEVADNGRGFEPGQVGSDRFGLESMRERAALIGGRLAVDSTPHDGARITVELPVAEGAA